MLSRPVDLLHLESRLQKLLPNQCYFKGYASRIFRIFIAGFWRWRVCAVVDLLAKSSNLVHYKGTDWKCPAEDRKANQREGLAALQPESGLASHRSGGKRPSACAVCQETQRTAGVNQAVGCARNDPHDPAAVAPSAPVPACQGSGRARPALRFVALCSTRGGREAQSPLSARIHPLEQVPEVLQDEFVLG